MLNNIHIKIIPHNKQRYETAGDWVFDKKGNLTIYISKLGNWEYEILCAIHEFVEVVLCKKRGIKQKVVDSFDLKMIKEKLETEPGDRLDAPYYREHQEATAIERTLAGFMGVNWEKYNNSYNKL